RKEKTCITSSGVSHSLYSGGLPQQGALKKENNPSQAPLWARPPKYKQYGAPDDVIQVFSFLLRQAAVNTGYAAHRMMLYKSFPSC
ncbi:MAG: hypothetical protein II134_04605, partial [Lachnospiraceae bacterium]|nr:hypothetical protein [Lachnospiraceae bacterium]